MQLDEFDTIKYLQNQISEDNRPEESKTLIELFEKSDHGYNPASIDVRGIDAAFVCNFANVSLSRKGSVDIEHGKLKYQPKTP